MDKISYNTIDAKILSFSNRNTLNSMKDMDDVSKIKELNKLEKSYINNKISAFKSFDGEKTVDVNSPGGIAEIAGKVNFNIFAQTGGAIGQKDLLNIIENSERNVNRIGENINSEKSDSEKNAENINRKFKKHFMSNKDFLIQESKLKIKKLIEAIKK